MIIKLLHEYLAARQEVKQYLLSGMSKDEFLKVMREYKILISGGLTNE